MSNKARNEISVLLIQPRADIPMVEHEMACIARYSGLEQAQFRSLSPFISPVDELLLTNVDCVIIGGSDTSVLDSFAWTESIIQLIHKIAEVKMPLFGSCWGHQMIARAFGGEVVSDVDRKEMGSIIVSLTREGIADPLFGGLPNTFVAQSGHKDHVHTLPKNIEPLAYSDRSPYQALRVKDLPIYGAQFHADMGTKELTERLAYYQYDYVDNTEFDRICASLQDSPEAIKVIASFVEQVVLGNAEKQSAGA